MRNKITISEPDVISNQKIKTSEPPGIVLPGSTGEKSNLEIIVTEGSEDFYNYIDWLGFSKDPNLVILSSMHHYYYDNEELKNVRTVASLIELNQIKQVTGFINSIFHLIPVKSHFIGCFVNNKKKNRFSLRTNPVSDNSKSNSENVENSISSRIPFLNMLYNLLDSKINKRLSLSEVTQMLSDHGFKVLDITELNGITYFCAQKLLTAI